MKLLYVGPSGRRFTREQLRAIHASGSDSFSYGNVVHIPLAVSKKNRFALPLIVGAVGAGSSLVPAIGAHVGTMGTVGAAGAGLSVPGTMIAGAGAGAAVPVVSGSSLSPSPTKKPGDYMAAAGGLAREEYEKSIAPIIGQQASAVGRAVSSYDWLDAASELGEPRVLSNNELIMQRYGATFSMAGDDDGDYNYDIDVDKLRKVLKKQYPGADIDAKIKLLPEDKYLEVALKDNPGREKEALMSNGFYSPTKDTAFLEKGDKLNTVRALIHELVHDMSNEGVEDYMLNEGYADYVAFKIMTQELGVPERAARRTLGYPDEVKRVESLVREYGREKVDNVFLEEHTLKGLAKTPLLALNT